MTGGCDGDDKDVDDFEDVDDDNDVDDIEDSDDVEDGDVAILISQSIVILSFFSPGRSWTRCLEIGNSCKIR